MYVYMYVYVCVCLSVYVCYLNPAPTQKFSHRTGVDFSYSLDCGNIHLVNIQFLLRRYRDRSRVLLFIFMTIIIVVVIIGRGPEYAHAIWRPTQAAHLPFIIPVRVHHMRA